MAPARNRQQPVFYPTKSTSAGASASAPGAGTSREPYHDAKGPGLPGPGTEPQQYQHRPVAIPAGQTADANAQKKDFFGSPCSGQQQSSGRSALLLG